MSERLTAEQEAEIKRRAQFANVPDDIRALLDEVDALRQERDVARASWQANFVAADSWERLCKQVENMLSDAISWSSLWKRAAKKARQERDDAKEVSARVWEAAFGSANEAPADWLEELQAMRAARAGLQPTTEPPREDGWYWWRFDEAGEWTVVRVGIINGEPRMYLSGHATNYKAEHGQWARAFPPGGGE